MFYCLDPTSVSVWITHSFFLREQFNYKNYIGFSLHVHSLCKSCGRKTYLNTSTLGFWQIKWQVYVTADRLMHVFVLGACAYSNRHGNMFNAPLRETTFSCLFYRDLTNSARQKNNRTLHVNLWTKQILKYTLTENLGGTNLGYRYYLHINYPSMRMKLSYKMAYTFSACKTWN